MKPRSQQAWYRFLKKAHLWIGLGLGIPLIALGLTGSVLVFQHELGSFTGEQKKYQIIPGEMRKVSEIIAIAKAEGPDGMVATMFRAPEEEGEPAVVRMSPPLKEGKGMQQGKNIQMMIDPVSLAVLDKKIGNDGILRTILQFHSNLLIRDYGGRNIVGFFGIAMLIMGISGIIMWWPKPGQWKVVFIFKWKTKGLRFHREIHGAVGVWMLLVFLTTSFTGVYLAFPDQTSAVIRSIFPARDLRATANKIKVTPQPQGKPIDIDKVVDIAHEAIEDDVSLLSIMIPGKPDQPYRVNMAYPDYEHGSPAITIFVDQWNAKPVEVRDPRNYSWGEKIMAWSHALHAGEGFGWTWRMLVFFMGFLPTLFAVTGFYMWSIKRKNKQKNQDAKKKRKKLAPVRKLKLKKIKKLRRKR